MFLRTKEGKIYDCHVGEQMGQPIYYPKKSKTNGYIDWNEVYKKSENIIDVLEVGDYVNGKQVINKWEEPDWYGYFIRLDGEETIPTIRKIETIVTKEQFESCMYKVKD